jgi:hypothetical protein
MNPEYTPGATQLTLSSSFLNGSSRVSQKPGPKLVDADGATV